MAKGNEEKDLILEDQALRDGAKGRFVPKGNKIAGIKKGAHQS